MMKRIFSVPRIKDLRLWPIAAGVGFTAIDATGELRGAAGGQDARLFHPVFALDPTFEVEAATDAFDVLCRPVGDLLVSGNVHGVQAFFDQHANAPNALEILRRQRTHDTIARADAMRGLGARLGVLIGL